MTSKRSVNTSENTRMLFSARLSISFKAQENDQPRYALSAHAI